MGEMMKEQWKPIPGFEGLYDISDRGRVRSRHRMVDDGNGGKRLHVGRLIKPSGTATEEHGYWYVHLYREDKNTSASLSKLFRKVWGRHVAGHLLAEAYGEGVDRPT